MDIEVWLKILIRAWKNHDVDSIISLFSMDVEYWETPYLQLDSFDTLVNEWQGIRGQKDIQVNTNVYGSFGGTHTVKWDLSYKNVQGREQECAGVYLIELNSHGKCTYFYQVGEKSK